MDRGQVFADIAPNISGEDWHQLVYVLEFLDPTSIQALSPEHPDLKTQGNLLLANYSKAQQLFLPSKFNILRKDLEAFEKNKSDELIASIWPTP